MGISNASCSLVNGVFLSSQKGSMEWKLLGSENLTLPQFHPFFLLLFTDNKCAKILLFISTVSHAECVTPIDTEFRQKLMRPKQV